MRGMRRVAAFGLALTLVCLTAAPVAAAPARAEEPGWAPVMAFEGFAERLAGQLADLFGDWMQSIFGSTNHSGDPNG